MTSIDLPELLNIEPNKSSRMINSFHHFDDKKYKIAETSHITDPQMVNSISFFAKDCFSYSFSPFVLYYFYASLVKLLNTSSSKIKQIRI